MIRKELSNILIVDDEPNICQLLVRFLTPEGYNCRTACGGEEALKALESDIFQLVLADIIMPGMSGIDLLSLIRLLYSRVAVIMVTGVDDRDTGILSVELGAYGYVIKPFERNEILVNVANALGRRRLAILGKGDASSSPAPSRQPITLKRSPIKIPMEEIVHLIKSGTGETSLMERFNLSAKAVNSLLDQLVAAKVLTQSELDGMRPLAPGSVVIDFDQATFPKITNKNM
jgi:DNA-binding response OmpR family regulator